MRSFSNTERNNWLIIQHCLVICCPGVGWHFLQKQGVSDIRLVNVLLRNHTLSSNVSQRLHVPPWCRMLTLQSLILVPWPRMRTPQRPHVPPWCRMLTLQSLILVLWSHMRTPQRLHVPPWRRVLIPQGLLVKPGSQLVTSAAVSRKTTFFHRCNLVTSKRNPETKMFKKILRWREPC